MESERLSIIISADGGTENLERCLSALRGQDPAPEQIVVVHGGSLDAGEGPLSTSGCQVVRVDAPRGIGAARNAGAFAAEGEILVFIAVDSVVRPGWVRALRRAFADGACLAGGRIDTAGDRSSAMDYALPWWRHDEAGRNGFLPLVSGAHLAVRRDVFLRLGGFDERGPVNEDVDFSLRAQLAGYPVLFLPDAELVHEPKASAGTLFKHGFQRARADRMTEQKYRRFPFMRLGGESTVTRVFASSAAAELIAAGGERRLSQPFLHAGIAAARRLGGLATDLELVTGLAPLPGAVAYRDPEQHNTSSPLPGGPAFLLLGDDGVVMMLLRLACQGGDDLIVAPPGLEREAVPRWDEPAPWSLRLVRTAVHAGWPLPIRTGAMRVEREQPRSWGESFLTLHRVHAWTHGRRRFGLAALGDAGLPLSERLPDLPIVIAGQESRADDRTVLRVTRRRLLLEPRAVGAELSKVIADEPEP